MSAGDDPAALRALGFRERGLAIERLRQRIAAGDVSAAEAALAADYSELTIVLRNPNPVDGPARRRAAQALTRFAHADPLVRLTARLEDGHSIVRINAAYDLGRHDEPAAVEALARALTDDETVVRVHAWNGLLRRFGLEPLKEPRHGPLGVLFVHLASGIPGVVRQGAERVRALVSQLSAGATAAELGLDAPTLPDDAHVEAFVASMRDPARPIDVAAVRAMDSQHRAWAIAMIFAATAHPDARAQLALDALGERLPP